MARATLLCLILLLLVPAARAEDEAQPHVSAMRKLELNRSLLERAESEYEELRAQSPVPGGLTAKRLDDLRYKIQALNEDAERLKRKLPPEKRDEGPAAETGRVDVHAERRIEKQMREIYALHEKALDLVSKDRYEEAIRVYEEITLIAPDDDEAYLLLGHTCIAAGAYAKAGSAFRSAMHIDPANHREITRLYENILVENPSDAAAMTHLGYAHLLLGNAPAARQSFEDALKVDPANAAARQGLTELAA